MEKSDLPDTSELHDETEKEIESKTQNLLLSNEDQLLRTEKLEELNELLSEV